MPEDRRDPARVRRPEDDDIFGRLRAVERDDWKRYHDSLARHQECNDERFELLQASINNVLKLVLQLQKIRNASELEP